MHVYLIEALSSTDSNSVYKKWCRKHRHHPDIKQPLNGFIYKSAPTPDAFIESISDFARWQSDLEATHPGERIVLWLSIHGSLDRIGVHFDNKETRKMHEILLPISHKLNKDVIIIQSICWGGFPTVGFVMNNADFGPSVMFGPTIAVRISALHYAERETFKLLSGLDSLTPQRLMAHINRINRWGATHHLRHNKFYRVYFWNGDHHRPQRFPAEPLSHLSAEA